MNFVFPHPLDTPRLRLRTFREEDAAPLFAMMSDPEVMRYWNTPPWTTPAQAREAILRDSQALVDGEYLNLAIERREDGQLLGSCILFHFEKGSRRAELGYCLARAAQGRGYMGEALRRLLAFAFDEIDLNRLEAEIDPRNRPSAASLERLASARRACSHNAGSFPEKSPTRRSTDCSPSTGATAEGGTTGRARHPSLSTEPVVRATVFRRHTTCLRRHPSNEKTYPVRRSCSRPAVRGQHPAAWRAFSCRLRLCQGRKWRRQRWRSWRRQGRQPWRQPRRPLQQRPWFSHLRHRQLPRQPRCRRPARSPPPPPAITTARA